MRDVLALTMIVWISGIGHASAQPGLEAFAGFTSGLLVGGHGDSVLTTTGLDLRVSTPIAPGTRLEGITTVGGPAGDRLSGVQLLRDRGTVGRSPPFRHTDCCAPMSPHTPASRALQFLRLAVESGTKSTRVPASYDRQWLSPLFGLLLRIVPPQS